MNNNKLEETSITYVDACNRVDAIIKSLTGIRDRLKEICVEFKELVDEYPDTIDIAVKRAPTIPRHFFERLLDVGRGLSSPELIYLDTPADYNRLRCLPMQIQEEVISEGVRVYEQGPTGELDFRLTRYEDLSSMERQMIFDGSHVRTPDEQRAWLRQRARQRAIEEIEPEEVSLPWETKDGRLIVRKPMQIKLREILLTLSPSERNKLKSLFKD